MKKLLCAEESSEIVRGEWSFGPTARMQVYFSKKYDKMPIYCRFYMPEDPKTYFGTQYKKAANEIETQWIKRKEGWAPSKIRNYKEQKTSDGKLQVGRSTRYQFFWDSSIKLNGKLLEFGEIPSEEIFDSFSEAR